MTPSPSGPDSSLVLPTSFPGSLAPYYTSADVADYLAERTLVPFLLDHALGAEAAARRLLAQRPERYLHAAVQHGVDLPLPAPPACLDQPAPAELALPTETWRELLARRRRCAALVGLLASSGPAALDDLITHNLDLRRLALDVVSDSEPDGVGQVLAGLTVLDPTCGEGAFLLATQRLIAELLSVLRSDPAGRGGVSPPVCPAPCPPVVAVGVTGRAGEPRPYAGRDRPRRPGCLCGVDLSAAALNACRERLGDAARLHLGNALDGPAAWQRAFPEVMARGGFDIILGNPPFLEARQVAYPLPPGHRTVHGACLDRCRALLRPDGRLGLVLPLALVSTRRLAPVRERLEAERSVWYANFAWRPARLFPNVNRPITVLLAGPRNAEPRTYTTGYRKWTAASRPLVLPTLAYVAAPRVPGVPWVPKLGDALDAAILSKLLAVPERLGAVLDRAGERRIWYRTTGGLYWKVFTDFAPEFSSAGGASASSRQTSVGVAPGVAAEAVIAALSSHVYWWWYTVTTTCRDNNPADLAGFPLPLRALAEPELGRLGREYLDQIAAGSHGHVRVQRQTGRTETQRFRIREAKPILDAIGRILAPHYGFTAEEAEHIECYDIKFRLGATAR